MSGQFHHLPNSNPFNTRQLAERLLWQQRAGGGGVLAEGWGGMLRTQFKCHNLSLTVGRWWNSITEPMWTKVGLPSVCEWELLSRWQKLALTLDTPHLDDKKTWNRCAKQRNILTPLILTDYYGDLYKQRSRSTTMSRIRAFLLHDSHAGVNWGGWSQS